MIQRRSPFRYYGPDCLHETRTFEQEFGQWLGCAPGQRPEAQDAIHVTAVNSGTGALEIALDALGVGAGDEVIVPGFMWISTISSVIRSRAIPVLIDSDDTLGLDPECLEKTITPRTKSRDHRSHVGWRTPGWAGSWMRCVVSMRTDSPLVWSRCVFWKMPRRH